MVGYGRAEKHQVQQMIKLLLGLDAVPSPHDAADALAVAHLPHPHQLRPASAAPTAAPAAAAATPLRSWRDYRP